jgi:hypothetical protein
MPCKLDENCPFSDQTPTCDRIQHCCLEKLAGKDAEIAELQSENSTFLHHMHDLQREFLGVINGLRTRIGELEK